MGGGVFSLLGIVVAAATEVVPPPPPTFFLFFSSLRRADDDLNGLIFAAKNDVDDGNRAFFDSNCCIEGNFIFRVEMIESSLGRGERS